MSIASAASAGAKGVKEAADAIAEMVSKSSVTLDAQALANVLNNVLRNGHGNVGGWNLYTRIETEVCSSCWFGFSSKWRSHSSTAWREYKKGGVDDRGTFETKLEAYRAARNACVEHTAQFNAGGKSE